MTPWLEKIAARFLKRRGWFISWSDPVCSNMNGIADAGCWLRQYKEQRRRETRCDVCGRTE